MTPTPTPAEIEEFNRRCAVQLKWRLMNVDHVAFMPPEEVLTQFNAVYFEPKDMHFHDSRDWSHLLVGEVIKRGWDWSIYYYDNCGLLEVSDEYSMSSAIASEQSIEGLITAFQESTAALRVLEGE